jgi:hypothetical protein
MELRTQSWILIRGSSTSIIKWWVATSFAVHPDMKSHTGGVMTLGKGTAYGTLTQQKVNRKSSTEAKLVGVNKNMMPQILWTRYFLKAQGNTIKDSIVNQDNQSTILFEKNGRASSGKRTCHINIRYFFVADQVASNKVTVQYCPTGEMIGDFFTKPLQGSLFQKLRNFIMNMDPPADRLLDHRSVLEHKIDTRDQCGRSTDQKVRFG